MTETIKKAAGYIRVSSPRQVREKDKKTDKWKEKISLEVQREKITEYTERHELKLIKIYEDAGISGDTVKNRPGLQECLRDGFDGKFDVLVVYNLSRFGRNAREVLNNYDELKKAEIDFISLKEGMDFSISGFGEAFLTISAALAQLDNDIRRETMLDGRIAEQAKG
jgi:site-specific DNA recombinase